jgi:DNA-binding MarR family transcriptional regulator/N-acetylglutamate synthase-like GNAT family acetyltransferase
MKFIQELGELAFATRLRLISETLASDIGKVYKEAGMDFEPKFFAIIYFLKQRGPSNISVIASEIGISQPAVSQLIDSLQRNNLINIEGDKKDTRKKIITLSEKTNVMLPGLERIWVNLVQVHEDIFSQMGVNIIDILGRLERVLEEKSLYRRIKEKLTDNELEEIKILDYKPVYKKHFRSLNYEWLKKYFTIEKHDKTLLNDPDNEIIRKGGFIKFAKYKNEIIGTCAMLKVDSTTFELSKMAVKNKFQGKGIGLKLADAVLRKAKTLKARKVILRTNPKLIFAFNLYRKLGFVKKSYASENNSVYTRPTFLMELDLKSYKKFN